MILIVAPSPRPRGRNASQTPARTRAGSMLKTDLTDVEISSQNPFDPLHPLTLWKIMRALLTSFGSTGAAQPFLALASALRRGGHQPLLALSPYFGERVRRLGFPFAPSAADADPDILRRVGAAQMTMGSPAEQVK